MYNFYLIDVQVRIAGMLLEAGAKVEGPGGKGVPSPLMVAIEGYASGYSFNHLEQRVHCLGLFI
jgi:hypothetical protein